MHSEESDLRRVHLARNQTLFREVNERVGRVANQFAADGPISFVCECSDTDCAQQIELSRDEYERVRNVPTWFAVRPGHEIPEIENVVEVNERYATVEKIAVGEAIAAATNPRQPM